LVNVERGETVVNRCAINESARKDISSGFVAGGSRNVVATPRKQRSFHDSAVLVVNDSISI
jgi:hypothetical protein